MGKHEFMALLQAVKGACFTNMYPQNRSILSVPAWNRTPDIRFEITIMCHDNHAFLNSKFLDFFIIGVHSNDAARFDGAISRCDQVSPNIPPDVFVKQKDILLLRRENIIAHAALRIPFS
jgi:hypothetical protein